jgi:hypothetical protein
MWQQHLDLVALQVSNKIAFVQSFYLVMRIYIAERVSELTPNGIRRRTSEMACGTSHWLTDWHQWNLTWQTLSSSMGYDPTLGRVSSKNDCRKHHLVSVVDDSRWKHSPTTRSFFYQGTSRTSTSKYFDIVIHSAVPSSSLTSILRHKNQTPHTRFFCQELSYRSLL